MKTRLLACALVALASPTAAQQTTTPPATPPATPLMTQPARYDHGRDAPQATVMRTSSPIAIDGRLSEASWASATPVTSFTQLDPNEGQPVSERTEVRFLYDDVALYIGARLYDRERVRSLLGRRDMGMSASDWLTVIIDAKHDHRTSFGFEINPAGVRRDQTRSGGSEDDSWDPVWDAATTISDSGWTAEIRIPFSQLRYSASVETWGLQVERQIARRNEFAVWAFTPRDQEGGAPRYGHLTGLRQIATGKRLEVMPYVVSRAEYIDRSGNPFRSNREYNFDVGADLKYRVTSALTLDATVNPDFGQVEVDPAVINLTAFETFFPEKRPFFIEGSEMFRFGDDGSGNNVFYSRRIGKQPSLSPPFALRDVPEATRILGAAKLTGRTAGGWTTGFLDAVTQRELARFETTTGESGDIVAEPLTNYFVGRVRRDARGGQSAFGALLGSVHRRLENSVVEGSLRSAAYSGGLDFFHQWSQRTWTLNGFVASSHVRGAPVVMIATQRLPYHYFQRPDADHLELDSSATSLTGFAANARLNKRIGRHWNLGTYVNTISPDYEVSDLGFQRRGDRIDAQVSANFQETRPGKRFRRWGGYAHYLIEHNYGWERISNRVFTGANGQLLNYWNGNINFTFSLPGTINDRLTRGGPAAARPAYWSVNPFISSDSRRAFSGGFGGYAQRGKDLNWTEGFGFVTIRPAPHWSVQFEPSFATGTDHAQFLRRVADTAAHRTYGARYVFAEIEQNVLALETRVNYTFTPGLSLQVYAQPFVATGKFGPPKELAAPRTYDFLVYGRDIGTISDGRIYPTGPTGVSFPVPQNDFNIVSLRGNAVLRWEWRPGSTMFVAWQQTRNDFRPIGDFDLRRDLDAIFATSPDDVLMVKMTYWFNP